MLRRGESPTEPEPVDATSALSTISASSLSGSPASRDRARNASRGAAPSAGGHTRDADRRWTDRPRSAGRPTRRSADPALDDGAQALHRFRSCGHNVSSAPRLRRATSRPPPRRTVGGRAARGPRTRLQPASARQPPTCAAPSLRRSCPRVEPVADGGSAGRGCRRLAQEPRSPNRKLLPPPAQRSVASDLNRPKRVAATGSLEPPAAATPTGPEHDEVAEPPSPEP